MQKWKSMVKILEFRKAPTYEEFCWYHSYSAKSFLIFCSSNFYKVSDYKQGWLFYIFMETHHITLRIEMSQCTVVLVTFNFTNFLSWPPFLYVKSLYEYSLSNFLSFAFQTLNFNFFLCFGFVNFHWSKYKTIFFQEP